MVVGEITSTVQIASELPERQSRASSERTVSPVAGCLGAKRMASPLRLCLLQLSASLLTDLLYLNLNVFFPIRFGLFLLSLCFLSVFGNNAM